MATAAIKNHLLPKLTRSHEDKEQQKRVDSGNSSSAQDGPQREHEKQFIAQWEDQSRPLEPNEITTDGKKLGESSSYLRPDDFQLIKTLGTGNAL
jgi:protein kinase A